MSRSLLLAAFAGFLSLGFAAPSGAGQPAVFLCAAPAGHTCQFAVRSAGGQIDFALPSGERKEVPGLTPHADTYCVCDPGPVTPDCKAPRLDHWCQGRWLDVDVGLNSENDRGRNLFAGRVPAQN